MSNKYTAETFLQTLKPFVLKDMQSSGILASLTAAQAFIESNKGNSGLTVKANNLFGMKGQYNGQSVSMKTTEYYNGVKTTIVDNFRKYPSWQESINDHSGLFNRSRRYENLRGEQDYLKACINVRNDGYATSPAHIYIPTLTNVIKTYKLDLWDYEVIRLYPVIKLRTVKNSSKGGGVRLLQEKLNIVVDGIFGTITEYAVKKFQREHGLVIDGIVGNKTWTELIR